MHIAAGCISVLLKNPNARSVNISDLLEEIKPQKQAANVTITKVAGKGHKSALKSVIIVVILIAIIMYLCREPQSREYPRLRQMVVYRM
jgi:hypothetical protein